MSPRPYYQDSAVTIYHGDCYEVLPSIGDCTVDLVLTDPPYNISERNGRDGTTIGRLRRANGSYREVKKDFGEWDRGFDPGTFLPDVVRALRDGGALIAFTSEFLIESYLRSGLGHRSLLIWLKTNPAPAFGRLYVRSIEQAVWQVKGITGWTFNGGGYESQVWQGPSVDDKQHPTEKPIPLMLRLISIHSKEDDLVLDPFMGSGTTLRAAKDLGRKAIGIEIEERYCEIAARRCAQEVMDLNQGAP